MNKRVELAATQTLFPLDLERFHFEAIHLKVAFFAINILFYQTNEIECASGRTASDEILLNTE